MAIAEGLKWDEGKPEDSPLNKSLVWNQLKCLQSIGLANSKIHEAQLAVDRERTIYMDKVLAKEISMSELAEIAVLWKPPLTIDLPMVLCQAYNEATGSRKPVKNAAQPAEPSTVQKNLFLDTTGLTPQQCIDLFATTKLPYPSPEVAKSFAAEIKKSVKSQVRVNSQSEPAAPVGDGGGESSEEADDANEKPTKVLPEKRHTQASNPGPAKRKRRTQAEIQADKDKAKQEQCQTKFKSIPLSIKNWVLTEIHRLSQSTDTDLQDAANSVLFTVQFPHESDYITAADKDLLHPGERKQFEAGKKVYLVGGAYAPIHSNCSFATFVRGDARIISFVPARLPVRHQLAKFRHARRGMGFG